MGTRRVIPEVGDGERARLRHASPRTAGGWRAQVGHGLGTGAVLLGVLVVPSSRRNGGAHEPVAQVPAVARGRAAGPLSYAFLASLPELR